MTSSSTVDGVLVTWGERLFYPGNRTVKDATPRLHVLLRRKASVIRGRIVSTVARRAPQVMVKVTGGGRGMAAIAAHFRYISKNGRLTIEDDRGALREGKESLGDLVEQWRLGGARIPEEGTRREAFNIMLSMPAGTDPLIVQRAAREFAQVELAGHRYVMVLHDHQANPHVHLSVKAAGKDGTRLNPRKADLHRWRETFAEKLRGWGIEAEASRQATRGEIRNFQPLWRIKAAADGRLRRDGVSDKRGDPALQSRSEAMKAWQHIAEALQRSEFPEDRQLAEQVLQFAGEARNGRALAPREVRRSMDRSPAVAQPARPGPDMQR